MRVDGTKHARVDAPQRRRREAREEAGTLVTEGEETREKDARAMGFSTATSGGHVPPFVRQEFMPINNQGFGSLPAFGNGNGGLSNGSSLLSPANTTYSNGLTPSYSGMSAFEGLENIENVDGPAKISQQLPSLPTNNNGLLFTTSAPRFTMEELELMLSMPSSHDNNQMGRTTKDYSLVRKATSEVATPQEGMTRNGRPLEVKPPVQKKTRLVDYRMLAPPTEPVQVKNSWRAFQEKESYLRCLKRLVDPGKIIKLGGLQNSKDLKRWVEALFGEQPDFEVWEQLNRPKDFWKRPDSLPICLAEFGSWVSKCTGSNRKISPDDPFIRRTGLHQKVKTGQTPAQEKASMEASLGIRLKDIRFPLTEANLWKHSIKGAEKKKTVVGIGPDPKTTKVLVDSHNKLFYLLDTKSNQLIGGPYQAATQTNDAFQ